MTRIVSAFVFLLFVIAGQQAAAQETGMQLDPTWEYVADRVMGGVSNGTLTQTTVQGRQAAHLTGQVSLDNNGGFIQMAFGMTAYAAGWDGLELDVCGNGEVYDLRLKTDQLTRPWQSFRVEFVASEAWTTVRVPFDSLEPYRTTATFDARRLRRVGVLAVGRAFTADVAVADVRLYRAEN
jgi:hypothetical protein